MGDRIDSLIYEMRNVQVMLDSDLADLFEVETKVFNQAVKRNINRFPGHFRFQLTKDEFNILKSQNVISSASDIRSQNVTLSSNSTFNSNDDSVKSQNVTIKQAQGFLNTPVLSNSPNPSALLCCTFTRKWHGGYGICSNCLAMADIKRQKFTSILPQKRAIKLKAQWMVWIFEKFLTLQQILTMNKNDLGFLRDGDIRSVAYIHSLGASVKKNDTADNLLLKDRIEK